MPTLPRMATPRRRERVGLPITPVEDKTLDSLFDTLSEVWSSIVEPVAVAFVLIVALRLIYVLRQRSIRRRRDAFRQETEAARKNGT